ncbi:hypothetical protein HNY73_018635 [Argiope bruennichi]|uniref:Uncharacterized protein n=1 Tax=Argiope bruennichi TaxID=94029 RepID=A0A8T0EGW4_ARGBR|nr:hypothetical protein HNY73_018635 [Argiope bruennichi]
MFFLFFKRDLPKPGSWLREGMRRGGKEEVPIDPQAFPSNAGINILCAFSSPRSVSFGVWIFETYTVIFRPP